MLYVEYGDVARIVELVYVAARKIKDEDGLKIMPRRDFSDAPQIFEAVVKAVGVVSGRDEPITIKSVPGPLSFDGLPDDVKTILQG